MATKGSYKVAEVFSKEQTVQKVLSIIEVMLYLMFGTAYGEAGKEEKTKDRITEADVYYLLEG